MKQMKCFLTYVLLAVCSLPAFAQTNVPVGFDERVDLVSMVWRLAGDEAYGQDFCPQYCTQADIHFYPYKDHRVVAMARSMMEQYGIGYDAVVSYGLHLNISKRGKLSFDKHLATNGDASFARWPAEQAKAFLSLLQDFYKESDFHGWYVSTKACQAEAEAAFATVSQHLDTAWFSSFFGPRKGKTQMRIVLSILVGQENYGCHALRTDGSEDICPVVGCCIADKDGRLHYDLNVVLPIVVHEICHSYCNDLDAQYWQEMEAGCTKLFEAEREMMARQAYQSPKVMLDETFVRSCVIRYMLSHSRKAKMDALLSEPMELGFVMTADVTEALGRYEQQRDRYRTMQDFMPEYVKAVNAFDYEAAQRAKAEAAKHAATYVCNIKDGATDIPVGEYALTITFSKPMASGVALGMGRRTGAFIPLANGMQSVSWSDDMTTLTVVLRLEPHTTYSFSILGNQFRTADGYNAGEEQMIDFTTK